MLCVMQERHSRCILVSPDHMGHVLTKQKLTRSQLKQFISTTPPCRVAFEACPGSQYWGRLFQQAGFEPKIIPAQFVKSYLKSNKNGFNDATAIAEAGSRGTKLCVLLKSHEPLALQATHRVCQSFIVERSLPTILEDAENGLPDFIRTLVLRLR